MVAFVNACSVRMFAHVAACFHMCQRVFCLRQVAALFPRWREPPKESLNRWLFERYMRMHHAAHARLTPSAAIATAAATAVADVDTSIAVLLRA
jgi:hypothetical protein